MEGLELTNYLKSLSDQREKELILLSRKFVDSFKRVKNENNDEIAVRFGSTDPDYPHKMINNFELQIVVPMDYPQTVHPSVYVNEANLPQDSMKYILFSLCIMF